MPPPILALHARNGVAIQAYRYIGATPSTLGSTIETAVSNADDNARPANQIVQFQGDIYAIGSTGVWKKNDPSVETGGWTQDVAFTGPEAVEVRYTGLHVVYVNDIPHLTALFGTSSAGDNDWRGITLNGSTGMWTESSEIVDTQTLRFICNEIVYRGVLHVFGEIATDDMAALTWDAASSSIGSGVSAAFGTDCLAYDSCVYNDRLFAVYNVNATTLGIVEFTGGVWTDVAAMSGFASIEAGTYAEAKWALFTDGTNLYAIVPDIQITGAPGAAEGWRCFQIDATLTIGGTTEITTTVLPAVLRSSNNSGSFSGDMTIQRMIAVLDQDTDATAADIYLYHSTDGQSGTSFTAYQWQGPSALMTAIDSGGDAHHSLSTTCGMSGERIFTAGELDIVIMGKQPVLGGQKVLFRTYGNPGVADKTVKFFFNTEGEPALVQATLSGLAVVESGSPAGAPSRVGNEIQDIDADGTVLYSAVWNISADSVSTGDRVQLKPQILL